MIWRALLICGVAWSFASLAFANGLQAQCGAESGKAYAAAQGIVRESSSGWYDDAMRGETVIRINIDTGEADVRFKDATGMWQSPSDQGGSTTLFAALGEPASFTVTVIYPGATIEVLTLSEVHQNSAKLIHTVARNTSMVTNARVLIASCVLSSF